jgi:hypothetical protein
VRGVGSVVNDGHSRPFRCLGPPFMAGPMQNGYLMAILKRPIRDVV